MKSLVVHELTPEGTIRCAMTPKKGGRGTYVTWHPSEITCLACQAARRRATS